MPEYDLGTAHGRIKIDVDDRGAKQAKSSVDSFEVSMQQLDKRLAGVQRSLTSMERDLRVVADDIKKAEQEFSNFADTVDTTEQNISALDTTTKLFTGDLRTMIRTVNQAKNAFDTFAPKIKMVHGFMQGFHASSGGFTGLLRGFAQSGAAGMGIGMLTNKMFGLNKVMQNIPNWQRSLLRFTGALGTLGGIAVFTTNLPKAISKLDIVARLIPAVAKHSQSLGMNMAFVADKVERFGRAIGSSLIWNFGGALQSMAKFGAGSNRVGQDLKNLAKSTGGALFGFNLLKKGLTDFGGLFTKLGFWGKVAFGTIGASLAIGPALIQAFSKSLVGLSNLFAGLINGVKELSGGFLALPGAIAMMGAAGSTVKVIFSGLKDAFKDIAKGGTDATTALTMLPPHLRGIGDQIAELTPKFKEFRTSIQATFFAGLDQQIKSLATMWMPLLQNSMGQVANAMRNVKDQAVGFLMSGSTGKDTAQIYVYTARAIQSIGHAVQPALMGLKDLAVVGAQFIQSITAGMPGLVQKFADFTKVNRENGNLLKWMQNSWRGVKNLTSGMIDLVKTAGELLTIFSTNNGENFLARFAASMKKLNETVKNSAATGALRSIADAVKQMGTDKLESFVKTLGYVGDALQAMWPSIKVFTNAMSSVMVPIIHAVSLALQGFFKVLNATHLDSVVAVFLSIAGALTLIWKLLGPIGSLLKVLFGTFMLFKNANDTIKSVVDVLGQMGEGGKKAANGVGKTWGAIKILTGAITAAIVAYSLYAEYQSKIDAGNKQIAESTRHAIEQQAKFRTALTQDKGKIGTNAFDAQKASVDSYMRDMQANAAAMPGIMDHIVGFFDISKKHDEQTTWNPLKGVGDPTELNRLQRVATASKMVTDGFDGIKASSDQITQAITGNEAAFAQLTAQLMASGENGKAAAGALAIWRKEAQAAAVDAAKLGEGGNLVVLGLQQIAKAAGNADDKLNGLKAVLEGLGILKTTALDAAAAYSEGIDNLAQKVTDSLDPTKSFTDLIDQQTKTFNIHADNGRNLLNVLEPLGQEYLNTISKGGDAGAAYEQFATQAGALADQINNMAGRVVIGREQILGLARDIGLVKPEELSQKLGELLNGPNREIFIKMGISQATIDAINKELNNGLNIKPILPQVDFGNKPGDGPHGGYADRAKKAAEEQTKIQQASVDEWQKYLETLDAATQDAADKAKAAGEKFSTDFAAGIESETALAKIGVAAGRAASAAHANLPMHSPAKVGPLSGRGWSKFGGMNFSRDFATGILQNAPQVTAAASGVAGAASSALSSVGMGQPGDMPGTNAGKFFGQLLDLTGFFSQINDVFTKISDTVFKLAKFMSDPMGNGTFFGKSTGFKKTVSASEIAKKQADAKQQAYTSAYDSARRPNDPRDAYGMPKIAGPGALQRDASQTDVQSAIVAEGQRRGMTQEQIQVALAIAGNESGYNKNNFGKGQGAFLPGGGKGDAYGVFQQTPEGGWGTPEQLMDPNYAINKFFDAYAQNLAANKDALVAGILTQNPQLKGTNINGQDYTKATIAQMADAGKALDAAIKSGSTLPTQNGMAIPGVGGLAALPRPSILTDTGSVGSSIASQTAAAYVAQNFPQVQNIGGSRNENAAPGTHQVGLAIDVGIPMLKDGVTRDMALGDQINAALKQNADILNIKYTIWRDILQNTKDGSTKTVTGHQDHIDVQFNDGSTGNIGPNGMSLRVPYGTSGLLPDSAFGPPMEPGATIAPPGETVQINPDGTVERVHGAEAGLPGEPLNKATGKPWTEAEKQAYFDMNKKQMDLGVLSLDQFQAMYNDNNFAQGSSQDQLNQMLQNPALANVQDMKNNPGNYTEQQINDTLLALEQYSTDRKKEDTAGSRQLAGVADSFSSSIMDLTGFTKNENPIDTIAGLVSSAAGVASDIIGTVITGIEAVGAADTIAKTGVRGIANTNDVNTVIDSVQKFIELGAKVSGSVSSVANLVGGIAGASGGMDGGAASGAISAVSSIASLVQAGFETANAIIDLTQEAFKIAGSYFGDFLGYLVGGAGGQLTGDVKFLLDQNTNQLLAYSQNNPLDKRVSNLPFTTNDTSSRNQLIGNINMYGGPGTDPRDMTRQMMFQVNSYQYAGALAQ